MSSITLYYKEARYDLLSIMRTPAFVIPALAFPLMFYLFFGVFFRAGAGADYLLVTYSCFGIMGPAMFNFAAGIASDRAHGWLTLKQLSQSLPLQVTQLFLFAISCLCPSANFNWMPIPIYWYWRAVFDVAALHSEGLFMQCLCCRII